MEQLLRGRKSMKRWMLNIGIVLVTLLLIAAVFLFINGSLEMYPTSEQIEKSRIASSIIGIICFAVDGILIKLRIKG